MSDKKFGRGRRAYAQVKTNRETCIDCPACLACMTCTVILSYCNVCRQTYLGITSSSGAVESYILLGKKHTRLCRQGYVEDMFSWICPYCLEKRAKRVRARADQATRRKLKGIHLEDGYSGEDEW